MKKKRIALTLIATLISELVNKLAPLVTLHIAATNLGAASFGLTQFSLWILEWGILLVSFGYAQAYPVASRSARDDTERKALAGSMVVARLIHAIFAIVLVAFVSLQVPSYRQYWPAVASSLFILVASAFDFSGVLIANQKVGFYSVIVILTKVASVVAVLLAIRTPEDAIPYVVITNLANSLICLGSFGYGVATSGIEKPSTRTCLSLMRIALPFATANTIMVLMERFDLYLIESSLGTTGAGWYSGPAKIMQSVVPIILSVSTVFYSEMVVLKERNALRRHFRIGLVAVFAFIFPLAVGTQFAGAEILEIIFGPGFDVQKSTLAILITGTVPHTLIVMVGYQLLGLNQKMQVVNIALLASALTGILAGHYLTAIFGYEGAATANTLAKSIGALTIVLAGISYRTLTAGDILGPMLKTGIPALAMGACLSMLALHTKLSTLGLVLTGAFIYSMALGALNIQDLRKILSKFKSALQEKQRKQKSQI